MPETGGGAATKIRPSWIDASLLEQLALDGGGRLLADRARVYRTASSVTKTAPALGALVKVAPEKPTMFTACAMPGIVSAISQSRFG